MTHDLETERLRLRRFTLADAPFILELLNDPAFLEFVGDKGVRTLEDARQYLLDGPLESYRRLGFGLYLVLLKADATPIGMCGLLKRDYLEDADIGFAFLPPYRSKGYAFESASAVLRHAIQTFGMTRVAGITRPHNAGSIRVLEKLGLRLEGRVRVSAQGPEDKLFGGDIREVGAAKAEGRIRSASEES